MILASIVPDFEAAKLIINNGNPAHDGMLNEYSLFTSSIVYFYIDNNSDLEVIRGTTVMLHAFILRKVM